MHVGAQEINPKTIKTTSKSLDIYSALRDPLTGEVRLFLEYYPFHQSQLTEEERHDAMQPALADVFWGCLFSNSKNFSQPVAIQAKRVCVCAAPVLSLNTTCLHFAVCCAQ